MKKATKKSRPTAEGQKAFELKQIRNRLPYIPEPTYHFEVDFINLNTRGKGMSPEHLEKVRGMLNAYAHSA